MRCAACPKCGSSSVVQVDLAPVCYTFVPNDDGSVHNFPTCETLFEGGVPSSLWCRDCNHEEDTTSPTPKDYLRWSKEVSA